jgi:hypothetical protein
MMLIASPLRLPADYRCRRSALLSTETINGERQATPAKLVYCIPQTVAVI